ncbi:Ankyrin repeat and BTB/POZ domain-containing protein 1 [Pleodorina starrii]|uniref:Ankyrin repeat and BTB/POZ domain-containing protein 1 n=1 Tax=Pleodorina starrii TaxID=330485 RepID=A0A9W6C1E5_9CHLO|nr:Ankyrin repeat and BTB/POZ domain-containing protein 1 [Pleodorina starrii]GLC61660.1 Ankyrin repeat and BTB/POZ domain-containing protein 1 [Pleodorina starrii]GLC76521.1 Ankyrin repeat and BTB/POZ domain-containing protein 1 [Pleodorina starrii]
MYAAYPVRGIAARPSAAGGEPETLLFHDHRIQVIVGRIDGGASKSDLPLSTTLRNARCPAYEPTSDCVLLTAFDKTAILQLDRSNALSLVAGKQFTVRSGGASFDHSGVDARFRGIGALAPDGQGSVYIADVDRIRKLDVASRVTTLPGTNPPRGTWVGLSYDVVAGVLWAANDRAVCVVDVEAGGDGGGRSLRLVGGDWQARGFVDGGGSTSRFTRIVAIMACADRRLLVLDGTKLRFVGADNIVNTVAGLRLHTGGPQCLGMLPQGDLAVGHGGSTYVDVLSGLQQGPCNQFSARTASATSSQQQQQQQHSQALVELHKVLAAQSASPAGELDSAVTVRVGGGGGRVFLAHRSVLAARSKYFRRLLDPAGGFADSGGAEVALQDADPEAFSWLLAYMYTGELHMPGELLRPAAELAGRLLMPAEYGADLQARLLAAVTPGSVVSELIWAAQHDMTDLVARLKVYLVRHRWEVSFDKLGELMACFPDLAASLVRELAAAL